MLECYAATMVRAEHKRVLTVLENLREKVLKISDGVKELDKGLLSEIKGIIDRLFRSMSIEEETIYSILGHRLGREKDLANEMLNEHRHISKLLRKICEFLQHSKVGLNVHKLKELLRELYIFLKQHFDKEDNVVLWMAEVRLTWKDWYIISARLNIK